MNYREYKKDGAKVSLLGYGGMRFPQKDGKIDREKSQKLIDRAYSAGVNYFDTAYMYHNGESELFYAEALAKYSRDSYFLADKMPVWMAKNEADVDRIFNEQLTKCNTDYFDYYLLHSVNDDVYNTSHKINVFEKLNEYRKKGKIKRLGFSFHGSIELLEKIIEEFDWDFVQLQLNYFDWDYQNAKRQYEIVTEHGLQCLVMEPVRGGALVHLTDEADEMLKSLRPDLSVPSWAMRFVASLEGVLCILSGMTDENALEDNISALSDSEPFTEADRDAVFRASQMLIDAKTLPCTACNYCSDCPKGIAIPKLFAIYNEYQISGNSYSLKESYSELKEGDKPFNCIDCGLCAKRCPQGISVPSKLKDVLKLAEKHDLK